MPWRSDKRNRFIYGGMYSLLLVAGAFFAFYPSQAILNALQSGLVYAWSGFLVTGGMSSFYGVARNKWHGEMIGLPLLSAANAIFAVALFLYAQTTPSYGFGLIFMAFSFGCLARWRELRRLVKLIEGSRHGS